MNITTHTSPDWDAIGSVWLLKQALPGHHEYHFVHAGMEGETGYTVDTGGCYDPAAGIFDHHFRDSKHKSAIMAIWANNEFGVWERFPWFQELVERLDRGDQGFSKDSFLHYSLHGIKKNLSESGNYSDIGVLIWGMRVLDSIAITLKERHEVMEHIAWRGEHVIMLASGNAVSTRTALEETGAKFAVFIGDPVTMETGEKTYPRGIIRNAAFTGITVRDVLPDQLEGELARWYVHPAGFFAGVGSSKASPEKNQPDDKLMLRLAKYAEELCMIASSHLTIRCRGSVSTQERTGKQVGSFT